MFVVCVEPCTWRACAGMQYPKASMIKLSLVSGADMRRICASWGAARRTHGRTVARSRCPQRSMRRLRRRPQRWRLSRSRSRGPARLPRRGSASACREPPLQRRQLRMPRSLQRRMPRHPQCWHLSRSCWRGRWRRLPRRAAARRPRRRASRGRRRRRSTNTRSTRSNAGMKGMKARPL